jgi:hypothetical protein
VKVSTQFGEYEFRDQDFMRKHALLKKILANTSGDQGGNNDIGVKDEFYEI